MEGRYVKYSRTPHLPWSSGTKDDRVLKNDSHLVGKRVIASIKMDGECTAIYSDYLHARSIDSESHPSQSWVRQLQSQIGYLLDDEMRVYGENVYAKHTIEYKELDTYFYGFQFWRNETCYDWDTTVQLFKAMGVTPVHVFYDGIYNKKEIEMTFAQYPNDEGYVLRIANAFDWQNFAENMSKYVRPDFKQAINDSNKHWKQGKVEKNKLKTI